MAARDRLEPDTLVLRADRHSPAELADLVLAATDDATAATAPAGATVGT